MTWFMTWFMFCGVCVRGGRQLMALQPKEGEHWMLWHYGSAQVMTQLVRTNPRTFLLAPELIQWEVDTYFKIRKDMHRLGVGHTPPLPGGAPSAPPVPPTVAHLSTVACRVRSRDRALCRATSRTTGSWTA